MNYHETIPLDHTECQHPTIAEADKRVQVPPVPAPVAAMWLMMLLIALC
jgi:hypothetical protein